MLSTFAAVNGKPLAVEASTDCVRLRACVEGQALEIAWRLPAGAAPLSCTLTLSNESAPADDFQFECFFGWHVPASVWRQTAVAVPGLAPTQMQPFGEIRYVAGDHADACAAWWTRGTAEGVALRAMDGVKLFFSGVHGQMFILGPHSVPKRLAQGESLSCAFEIATPRLRAGAGMGGRHRRRREGARRGARASRSLRQRGCDAARVDDAGDALPPSPTARYT